MRYNERHPCERCGTYIYRKDGKARPKVSACKDCREADPTWVKAVSRGVRAA